MIPQVVTWGYLAVLERLRLRIPTTPPMEGGVGQLICPTLTCDAPIVALSLKSIDHKVVAAFSHPGTTPSALTAMRLLEEQVPCCHFGPEKGTPLALQVISPGSNLMWFSDPGCGIASMMALPTRGLSGRWVYLDAYPWLADVVQVIDCPTAEEGVFINFGTVTASALICNTAFWRQRIGSVRLVCQASIGQTIMMPSEIRRMASAALMSGADLVLITAGANGLVLASGEGIAVVRAQPILVKEETDGSGAGAAVSVALLRALLADSVNDLEGTARSLTIAGAAQSSISGALDADTLVEWRRLLGYSVGG